MANLTLKIGAGGRVGGEFKEGPGNLTTFIDSTAAEPLATQIPDYQNIVFETTNNIVTQNTVVETEEEIVNQETILNYYDTLTISDRATLTAALRTSELSIIARERAELRAQKMALGLNTGLTSEEYSTSAWQIKQDYPDSEDGVYWIQNDTINDGNPVQVYCDMTTLGGGWTLVLQNNYVNWDKDTALSFRSTTPPTTLVAEGTSGSDDSANYSIYGWADAIKRSATGFDYMIEAYARGRNGGAWTVNQAYNFLDNATASTNWGSNIVSGSDGFHQDITEIELFPQGNSTDTGVWTYSDAGIEKRMPWYSNPDVYAPTQAIITTTHNDGDAWFGTLVANNTHWPPAPWIGGGNTSGSVSVDTARPLVIWMWVR